MQLAAAALLLLINGLCLLSGGELNATKVLFLRRACCEYSHCAHAVDRSMTAMLPAGGVVNLFHCLAVSASSHAFYLELYACAYTLPSGLL